MTRTLRNVIVLAAVAGGLAACGGSDNNAPAPPPPVAPPVATPTEDRFGANFGTLFRAAPNTDPRDAVAADLGAVSITTDPVTI